MTITWVHKMTNKISMITKLILYNTVNNRYRIICDERYVQVQICVHHFAFSIEMYTELFKDLY